MPYTAINLGAAPNDRTGDAWRTGGLKINTMFSELFTIVESNNLVFISQESDFPTQDATTITLEAAVVYVITASFATDKYFVCLSGSKITAFNLLGPILTYNGTGGMFRATDNNFTIELIGVSAPSGTIWACSDTITPNSHIFQAFSVAIYSCREQ